MNKFKVVEKFVSIDGEGPRAGLTTVFIRFAGCNLRCSYCDTKYAQHTHCEHEVMTDEEIKAYLKETGFKRITFTGGEPLLQDGLIKLANELSESYEVSIETNGSVDFGDLESDVQVILDYKTESSGMEGQMDLDLWVLLEPKDAIKFVVGSVEDMDKAKELMSKYYTEAQIFFSPIFGKIEAKEIVEYVIANKLVDVRVQVQLHKIIWNKDTRGV